MSRRPTTVLLAAALAAGAVAGLPAPAQAAALPYTAHAVEVPGLVSPSSLTSAGGHLFVADGNGVVVLDGAGHVETTISGIFGATAVTAAPGGGTVYAAASTSSTIAAIDVASLTKVREFSVAQCPKGIAVTPTTLFYSAGCDYVGVINHVDLASLSVNDLGAPDASGFYEAPSLRADGTRLYALDYFGGLSAWPTTGGSLGPVATATTSLDQVRDWAVSGGRVAILNMNVYGYSMYDGGTLAKIADLRATAYPQAVGFTPDGGSLIGGVSNQERTFWVFNPSTGQATRTVPLPAGVQTVGAGTAGIGFSADGSVAYQITRDWPGDGIWHYSLVGTTLGSPGSTTVAVVVVPPARPGAATRFTVTGTPNQPATVEIVSNGATTRRTVALGATGRATLSLVLRYSGKVTASVAGDLTHSGFLSSAVAFREPTRTVVRVSRGYKTVRGVVYYARTSQAQQRIRVTPSASVRPVTAQLFRSTGRGWTKVQTMTIHTDVKGVAYTHLVGANNGVAYQMRFTFKGDASGGASSGRTPVFRVG